VTNRRCSDGWPPSPARSRVEAAEAICADDHIHGWAVVDLLSRLVDKSLVLHDPDTGWYRLLETLRLYAVERCREAGELHSVRDLHTAWWTRWLVTRSPDAPSDGDLDGIQDAYPNLRTALEWAAATQPELALELAGGLAIYWYLQGLLGDAVTLGNLALAASPDHGRTGPVPLDAWRCPAITRVTPSS